MKIVLTILLSLSIFCSIAQPVVISKKESAKKSLNQQELDKQYPETQEVGMGLPASISGAIRNALDKAMGPEKVEMLGTIRNLSKEDEAMFIDRIRTIVTGSRALFSIRAIIVTPMAMAMPTMPYRLPWREVSGDDRPRRARMNRTPETR